MVYFNNWKVDIKAFLRNKNSIFISLKVSLSLLFFLCLSTKLISWMLSSLLCLWATIVIPSFKSVNRYIEFIVVFMVKVLTMECSHVKRINNFLRELFMINKSILFVISSVHQGSGKIFFSIYILLSFRCFKCRILHKKVLSFLKPTSKFNRSNLIR